MTRADGLLVFWPVASPKAPLRFLRLLGGVQVDDTVFAKSNHGVLLVADRDANTGTIYAVTTPVWPLDAAYSAGYAEHDGDGPRDLRALCRSARPHQWRRRAGGNEPRQPARHGLH